MKIRIEKLMPKQDKKEMKTPMTAKLDEMILKILRENEEETFQK